MSSESSHAPSVEYLRAAAQVHGVEPADADLAAVRAFLDTILPKLREIEERQGGETSPAGLFLPDPGPS
jgi:hypothetical protein